MTVTNQFSSGIGIFSRMSYSELLSISRFVVWSFLSLARLLLFLLAQHFESNTMLNILIGIGFFGAGATPTLPANKEQAGAMRGSIVCFPPHRSNREAQM